MKKSEMMKFAPYVGDFSTLFGAKEYEFTEGKAKGVKAVDINNGNGIQMTVIADKCMDISHLSFKGMNIGYASKVGVVGTKYYNDDGGAWGFLKQFIGGFVTTCGVVSSGAPTVVNGRRFGLHGYIANCPAESFSKEITEENGQMVIKLSGTMREAASFAEFVKLHRTITVETERNVIRIHDVAENCGFNVQPVMNAYHMNFGFPMLDESGRVYIGADNIVPRDEEAAQGMKTYNIMEKPQVGYEEQCFLCTCNDSNRQCYAMLHNENRGVAAVIRYKTSQLGMLVEWKNMMAGDYALGLEPTVAGVGGREEAERTGLIRYINPGEKYEIDIEVELLDDPVEIAKYIK